MFLYVPKGHPASSRLWPEHKMAEVVPTVKEYYEETHDNVRFVDILRGSGKEGMHAIYTVVGVSREHRIEEDLGFMFHCDTSGMI